MTSSTAIEHYLKSNLNFLGCFPLDRLPLFPKTFPKTMIVNTQKSSKSGEHWLALLLTKNKCYYFDSFGWGLLEGEIGKFLKDYYKTVIYSTMCIQHIESDKCGEYCISFIQNVKCQLSYNIFLLKFDSINLENNDKIFLNMLK